ncbi:MULTISPECIES: helix-turn-helix domain-containing protein [unclassified Serratia (in: enterobacteria)]|uniref:winged helix-turn-helix domain-containing protein n=1 Tax=unclassified Serratia (in: enterobacteria) TaxID=2647522 RepID=UPI00046864E4|nr:MULTISPECIES: helix-turn-helix domain-containing protein [unclassified Serratia (in: enterobacteria)]
MVFTIFNVVAFRSEDGAMWNIAQPDRRLSLTTIPARLFTYLLENADKMVGREELLNNIWDKYGLEPSNNSVNQYISLIRKSLSELGCDEEIIKTIPRMGFYITGEMVSRNLDTLQSVVSAIAEAQPAKEQPRPRRGYKPALLALSVIISTLLILQPFRSATGRLDYSFPKSTLYKIGTIDTCPVYSLTEGSSYTAARKQQLAQELSAAHAPCISDEVFIFQAGEHYAYQQSGRAFIARCADTDHTLSHFSDCRAVYVFAK